jgi:hypothetical protein
MAKTLRIEVLIDVPTVPVPVRGRVLEVRAPTIGADRAIEWRARRPGWCRIADAVDQFLAACLEPKASATEIRELSEHDRRRLMLAVVRSRDSEGDWRRLHGTMLNLDERFFSVMLWARRREAESLRRNLQGLRKSAMEDAFKSVGGITTMTDSAHKSLVEATKSAMPTLSASEEWKSRLAEMTKPFLSMHEERLARLGQQVGAAGILDKYAFPTSLGRHAEDALGLRPTAVDPNMFGSGGALDGLARQSLRAAGLGANPRAEEALQELGGLSTRLTHARLAGWADGASIAAIKALRDRHDSPWLMSVSGIAREQLGSMLEKNGVLWDDRIARNWDLGLRLPKLPMYDGRVSYFLEQGDFSSLFPATKSLMEGLVAGRRLGVIEKFDQAQQALMAAARFRKRWSEDPLWFLLNMLSPQQSLLLVELKREQVYDAIFTALEAVVRNSELVDDLRGAIDEVPFLTYEQREWLKHGLGLAKEGNWLQAAPPLFFGLEGALHGSALEAEAVEPDAGHLMGPEKIVKRIELGPDFELFAVRLAFGKRGQPFRHGRPKHDSREQALILIVAVIGWLDYALDVNASLVLARDMRTPLRSAVLAYEEPYDLVAA